MLKVGTIILIIMLAYAVAYSVIGIIEPKLTTGNRNTGVYALTTAISGFFILFAGFQKAQKWAWLAFLVVGGIAWLWGLIYSIAVVDKVNIILTAVGMVIFLVGLLLPVKAFFVKKQA